jgi:ABC-type glycerol-3-phosphate transport system substrate-binding protein
VDDLGNPTRVTFNDLLNIEALEWYFKLMHEYDAIPTPEEMQAFGGNREYRVYAGFSRGQVGMWTGSFSQAGGRYWPTQWDMRWGVLPLPRDAQAVTFCSAEGLFISSQTDHPRECWQWIAFLSGQVPERLVPARKSLVASSAYEQQVGSDVAAAVRQSMEGQLLMAPASVPQELEQAMEKFGEAIGTIVDGSSTPLEAMEWVQQEVMSK